MDERTVFVVTFDPALIFCFAVAMVEPSLVSRFDEALRKINDVVP